MDILSLIDEKEAELLREAQARELASSLVPAIRACRQEFGSFLKNASRSQDVDDRLAYASDRIAHVAFMCDVDHGTLMLALRQMYASTLVSVYTDNMGTYQARCLSCDWRAAWRRSESKAVDDAKTHNHG